MYNISFPLLFAPVMTDSLCHVSGPLKNHDGFEELMEPTLSFYLRSVLKRSDS